VPQLPLFPSSPKRQDLPISDGELSYWPQFYAAAEATSYQIHLQEDIDWQEEEIVLFGKRVMQPRLTAWYGDPGVSYTYSGLTLQPKPWTPALSEIKQAIEAATGHRYNSVLLNFYRHGRDSMGWHSDDEPALGTNPAIASLSLGEARRFHLRHRDDRQQKVHLDLAHGSLLLMAGALQHHWQHQLPKSQRPLAPRINLTFRRVC
jgi:alkylated DNA repair dioxygenase AlkB